MIVPNVFHLFLPLRFLPRNVAPTFFPTRPRNQVAPSFSGDHSPMRVKSDTIAHTLSGGALISWITLTCSAIGRRVARAVLTVRRVHRRHTRPARQPPVRLAAKCRQPR